MELQGRCDHCGGEIYAHGDDEWWVCAECGCTWSMDGQLIRRGPECVVQSEVRSTLGYAPNDPLGPD